jgi:hypothetical protein
VIAGAAHQQTVTLGQPDRAPETTRNVGRRP